MKLLKSISFLSIIILLFLNYSCSGIDDDLGLDDIIESYSVITASRIKRRSLKLNWLKISEKVREMENLQYKVVRSSNPDIDTTDNALANGLLEMDWTTDTNALSVTNLEIDTTYYFNVIVRDETGRIAAYKMKKVKTLDPNTPLPGNDGTMSVINVSTNFVTINWTAAQDENFTQADLNYRIYYSTANNIDTLENIELNGTPVGNFSNNVVSLSANGLTEGTMYYFNVIVSNNNGYKSAYNTLSKRTADSYPPIPGSSGKLMLMKVLSNSMDIEWTKASDTYTPEADIEYKVVYSASDNVSTVADAESNGTVITDWTKDINTTSVSGLGIDTTYYFNVIVKDHWGNKTVYTSKSRKTADANNNYLYNPSFELNYSGWSPAWTPPTSGRQIHLSTHNRTGARGGYFYTGSTTAASFNKETASAVPWNPGEAAVAWIWFRPAETRAPAGNVIIRVTFRNASASTLATYSVKMNDANEPPTSPEWHTSPLYLETPVAPANTVDAVYMISLEKDATTVSRQLTISFDDAHLGLLLP